MYHYDKAAKYSVTCMIAMTIVACGGGGGGGGGIQIGGIERLGVSSGTVTGFGSIFVNGVEIETSGARFTIDDAPGSESQLEVGDVVVVTFDPDVPGPTADTVFADEVVEGPIDSIDTVQSRLVVAGQSVAVDADTSFDDRIVPASLDGLLPGEFVEVSGFFDSAGDIRATRIEPGAGEVEVHGAIAALDTTSQTFSIKGLQVDYGAVPAVIDDGFPGGQFNNGDFIEVKGTAFGGSGELLATRIEPDGLGVGADPEISFEAFDEVEIEIEGLITRFGSSTDFDVADFPVITNGQTVFEGGTPSNLGLNVKVEVEGELNAAGMLVADKVDIRRSNDVRVTALVDDVAPGNSTVTMLGITVRVDAITRLEDKSDADLEPFRLSDINVGDYLEVRGAVDAAGTADVIAALLERENPPDNPGEDTELRGPVDAVSAPSFTILGVTIETNAGTVFRDIDDSVITASEFFAQADGRLVDADGVQSSTTVIIAEEVDLED